MANMFGNHLGYKFFENPHMTIPGPDVEVKRTWKERLLSTPWRPWVPTKMMPTQIPDPQVMIMGDSIFAHPSLITELRGYKL